jgi:hypothetical protein
MSLWNVWNVTVYDDEMVDRLIRNAGNLGIISKEEVDMLIGVDGEGWGHKQQTAHIVERCDRYCTSPFRSLF